MRKILHSFNMIEIVLAIGVVAFGVTAVMALLPPSLNANRDVSADAFAVEATSKVDALLELFFRAAWDTYVNGSGITENAPKDIPIATEKLNIFAHKLNGPVWPDELLNWNIFETDKTYIFYLESPDRILENKNKIKTHGTATVQAYLWKAKINDLFPGGEVANPGYDKAARIFIELSWPITVSYANRQKRIIVKELYK